MAWINCDHCGKRNDFHAWTRVGGRDLPNNEFECPSCNQRIRLRDERPVVMPSGFVRPGKRHVDVIRPGKATAR